MTRIHLEGMGVMGSLTAHLLASKRIPFTWHDTIRNYTAWQACTGIVYPSGSALDFRNYRRWGVELYGDSEEGSFGHRIQPYTELARWCYYSSAPPHQGKRNGVRTIAQVGKVRVSNLLSMHFNAQHMVNETRHMFKGVYDYAVFSSCGGELQMLPKGTLRIVTHGFHERTMAYSSWGWTQLTEVSVKPELKKACTPHRPCLYMRDGMVLDYAYPCPGGEGRSLYYAGTHLINQPNGPRELTVHDKWAGWATRMGQKLAGAASIRLGVSRYMQGWRPVAREGLDWVERQGDTVYIRPMYGSGLRHWWEVADRLLEAIG